MDAFLAIPIYTGIYCQPHDKAAWFAAPHGLKFVKQLMFAHPFPPDIYRCLFIANPDLATNAANKLAKMRVAQTILNEVKTRVYKLRLRAR